MGMLRIGIYACADGECIFQGSVQRRNITVKRLGSSRLCGSEGECSSGTSWRKSSLRRIGSKSGSIWVIVGERIGDYYEDTADECRILLWIFPYEDGQKDADDELSDYNAVSAVEYIDSVYMPMTTLNIWTTSQKLAAILKAIKPLSGFTHNILTADGLTKPEGHNIIITGRIPEELLSQPDAKYILCTKTPQTLHADILERLYDLWPLPITPVLVRYLFGKVQIRIKYETDNSAENSEHQKRILEMARQDYLTGLATRWYLQDFIESNRHERNITCIYLDLDNFKGLNDTFGHQAGDRALAATAEMMQNEFPDGFSARMGGDEFMIVLLGKRDIMATADRVKEFMTKLLKYYATTRTMKALSVSAGISQSRPDAEKTIDKIIHEADRALYEAKKSGKSRYKVYSDIMG